MADPLRADDRRPYNELETASFFRWVVGGVLVIAGTLVGVLWFMLMGQITELKTSIGATNAAVGHVSDLVLDMKGDMKLLSAQAQDQSKQISEVQGFLKKK